MMLCVTLSAHEPPRREWGRRFECMRSPQRSVVTRSTTARGCTSGIVSITAPDARCPDVTTQLSAVQACWRDKPGDVAPPPGERRRRTGRTAEIVEELEIVNSGKHVFRPWLVTTRVAWTESRRSSDD
jgi:hypothetical protein